MMSRDSSNGNGHCNWGWDVIYVTILFLLMDRSNWSIMSFLLVLMMVRFWSGLLYVMRLFYDLRSTVNFRLELSWLICRSRVRNLAQVKLFIRSVYMVRHSADVSMFVYRDRSKIMHDMLDLVGHAKPLHHGRVIYGPMLLLEFFLGRSSRGLLVLLLFLGRLGLSWLRWLLRGRHLVCPGGLGLLLLGGMLWLSLLGLLLLLMWLLLLSQSRLRWLGCSRLSSVSLLLHITCNQVPRLGMMPLLLIFQMLLSLLVISHD